MKTATLYTALKEIDESAKGKQYKFDIYFKSSQVRLTNVTLDEVNSQLYRSTDNIGKQWYFSVEDVLMISKFNQ